MNLKIYIRGSSRWNEEKMRAVVLIKTEEKELVRMWEFQKRGSPIEAEYLVLIKIVEALKNSKKSLKSIEIYSTIETVVRQMEGKFRVNSGKIAMLYGRLTDALNGINYKVNWISKAEMDKILRPPVSHLPDEKLKTLLDKIDFDVEELWR